MRVADYIAEFLSRNGVDHIFLLSGGGLMFLTDGIAQHPTLEAVCMHHEQAAAMAAASYAKYRQSLGACYLTTGCGGTNAVTGLLNAWQDNIPCFFISGQVKRKETTRNSGLKLRQFGVQELDIIPVVESLTKYAVMINEPNDIRYHLEKALHLATSGRPGPVWIDVPLDVQGASIEEADLRPFVDDHSPEWATPQPRDEDVHAVARLIDQAERPIIIAGQGIRLAGAVSNFSGMIERAQIPFVVTNLSVDFVPAAHPLNMGLIGIKGTRHGNFAVQNADLVISIGSRLSVTCTGFEYELFAREAPLIVVDIDPEEHKKDTVRIEKFIHADAKVFLEKLSELSVQSGRAPWLDKCQSWKAKYPVCLPEYRDTGGRINLYTFVDSLSQALNDGAVVISDAGSSAYVTSQALRLRAGQRYITSGGQMEMGYSLPAAVGVSFARNQGETIGITGDGSFQLNIQDLQTIVHHNLPIKLFVWNNDGYLSIRATQARYFEGRFLGTDARSGVSFPDLEKIAGAYGISFVRLDNDIDLVERIKGVLGQSGPVLCEVMCLPDQEVVPAVASMRREDGSMVSKPIEDMYPFLDREEFREAMIVEPIED